MMRCPQEWQIYRRSLNGEFGDEHNGLLMIPAQRMKIMFSNGENWEHVSVSFEDRCPTWDEMESIKRRFWEPGDTVMQLHVPTSDHKNCHPFCLHLWRPITQHIPRPPSWMVA